MALKRSDEIGAVEATLKQQSTGRCDGQTDSAGGLGEAVMFVSRKPNRDFDAHECFSKAVDGIRTPHVRNRLAAASTRWPA